MEFSRRYQQSHNSLETLLLAIDNDLTTKESKRLKKLRHNWNFYEGYHWEDIPPQDKPEVTENYCRAFVNKFVSFEFGKEFNTKVKSELEDVTINDNDETLERFLERVWDENKKESLATEIGQEKAVTGDAWVHLRFYEAEELEDPFDLYPNGKIRIQVMPSVIVFPKFDPHDKDKLEEMVIKYPISKTTSSPILKKEKIEKVVYKKVWTRDKITTWEGDEKVDEKDNPYGFIPFVQTKNYPLSGREYGVSDLEDIIPLNVEINMKKSDISEIIDYHSAPVTVVFGAKISKLQKGANKVWGGLPTDANVKNLELNSDLSASNKYIDGIKESMHEVGNIPQGSLGGNNSISNTSGVALQFANMPIIERVRVKRNQSKLSLEEVNKIIVYIAEYHNLITIPEGMNRKLFYDTEINMPETLPKDELIELQKIQQEMQMGLEDREGALERTGTKEIQDKIAKIKADREENPDIYGIGEDSKELNSGMTNGQTAVEQVRKEANGSNSSE
jgi:hypothetical protein